MLKATLTIFSDHPFLLNTNSVGIVPVRVFFHVDYKPKSSVEGRKVGKDDMNTLSSQLEVLGSRIKAISQEIDHARRQEIAMKEAGGKLLRLLIYEI